MEIIAGSHESSDGETQSTKLQRESLAGNAQRENRKVTPLSSGSKQINARNIFCPKVGGCPELQEKADTWKRVVASLIKFYIYQTSVPVERRGDMQSDVLVG